MYIQTMAPRPLTSRCLLCSCTRASWPCIGSLVQGGVQGEVQGGVQGGVQAVGSLALPPSQLCRVDGGELVWSDGGVPSRNKLWHLWHHAAGRDECLSTPAVIASPLGDDVDEEADTRAAKAPRIGETELLLDDEPALPLPLSGEGTLHALKCDVTQQALCLPLLASHAKWALRAEKV